VVRKIEDNLSGFKGSSWVLVKLYCALLLRKLFCLRSQSQNFLQQSVLVVVIKAFDFLQQPASWKRLVKLSGDLKHNTVEFNTLQDLCKFVEVVTKRVTAHFPASSCLTVIPNPGRSSLVIKSRFHTLVLGKPTSCWFYTLVLSKVSSPGSTL